MKKKARARQVEPPSDRRPGSEELERRTTAGIPAVSWAVTFGVLAILLATLVWFPLTRTTAHYEMGWNEGSNSYSEQAVANGTRLYSSPPTYINAAYPPLSFYLIAGLGKFTHDMNVAGRWVSVASYFLIAVFMAMIVQRLTDCRRFGVYAGLCWLIWLAAFDPTRIGFNDPHLLGIALNLAGMYCFVRNPESARWLRLSAVVFAISVFTKQSLLAFPAAVGIQLFLSSRKRLAIWLSTVVSACGILLILTLLAEGPYFLDHMMPPRTYSWTDLATSVGAYLWFFQTAFAAALIWAFRSKTLGPASVLIWGFALAHVMGAVICSESGAGTNHLFDALISTALIVGVSLPVLERISEGTRLARTFLAVLLLVPFFLSSTVILPQRIPDDVGWYKGIARTEAEFASATRFVRSQTGAALCESMLLCYEAGKPWVWDAFIVDQRVKTGRLAEGPILESLDQHQYGAIEIDFSANEPLRPSQRMRFSEAFMQRLFKDYRPAYRDFRFVIFIPNRG